MVKQPVLTLPQVARYFSVHPNTIYRLAQRGRIPAFKVGSDWRFHRESIDAWRLAQERLVAQKFPEQTDSGDRITAEVLDIMRWYEHEALQDSVSLSDLNLFLSDNETAIRYALRRMVLEGLVITITLGRQARYRLTPADLSRVRPVAGRTEKTRPGHASFMQAGTAVTNVTGLSSDASIQEKERQETNREGGEIWTR